MKELKVTITKEIKCVRFSKHDEKVLMFNKKTRKLFLKKLYETTAHKLVATTYVLTNVIISDVVEFELWDDLGYIFSYIVNKNDWDQYVINRSGESIIKN